MVHVEHVRRWIQALESGEFRQCRDALTRRDADGESHDAVGVLIVLAMRDGVELRVEWDELLGSARYGDGDDWVLPPEPVCEWIGLDACQLGRYVELNDDGASFMEIAATIRGDFGLAPRRLRIGLWPWPSGLRTLGKGGAGDASSTPTSRHPRDSRP